MGLLERVARLDERSAITTDRDRNRRHAGRIVVGQVMAVVIGVGLVGLVGLIAPDGVAGAFVMFGLCIAALVFVAVYTVMRRRRNRRLTGSPTDWPE